MKGRWPKGIALPVWLLLPALVGPGAAAGEDFRASIGAPVRIEAAETVKAAVVLGGSVTVAGRVEEDAVAVGGSVILEEGAEVGGDAVALGGSVQVAPGAVVRGSRVSVGPFAKRALNLTAPFLAGLFAGTALKILGIVTKIARAVAVLVLGLFFIALFPKRVARTGAYLAQRPGLSGLAGFGVAALLAPLLLTFLFTIVGIPLIPLTIFVVVALAVFGLVAFAAALGERLLRRVPGERPMGAFLLGLAVLTGLQFIPFVGSGLLLLAAIVSMGAALMSGLGSRCGERPAASVSA